VRLSRLGRAGFSVDGRRPDIPASRRTKSKPGKAGFGIARRAPRRATENSRRPAGSGAGSRQDRHASSRPRRRFLRRGGMAPVGRKRFRSFAGDVGIAGIRAVLCGRIGEGVLAAGDRSQLSAIVDAIARRAKRDLAKRTAAPHVGVAPDVDRPSRTLDSPPRQASYRLTRDISVFRHLHRRWPSHLRLCRQSQRALEKKWCLLKCRLLVPPIANAFVEAPAPAAGQRNATITSADDDLTELISQFAPDSSLLRKD